MGRRKIEIKAIKDDRNRSVTFLKRKGGLFKKAHELSVLCSVDVAVIIFGNNKKLYQYSSVDMREIITRYQYHGGPNEHKGPSDFNGGMNDDDDDEDGDGTPPRGHDGIEAQMMPPQFPGPPGPPFPHIRHQTASASPPISNGVPFQPHPSHLQRAHTPQPIGSRPGSRNDMRRMGPGLVPQAPHPGITYMPTPPIYNPTANQPNMMHHPPPTFPFPPAPQQPYMEDRRPSAPPTFAVQPPPPPQAGHIINRTAPSPPQPPPPPMPQASPQPDRRLLDPQPPPPVETNSGPSERPRQPFLNTDAAIKKMPARKGHSIFTPIEENHRSILSQHVMSFAPESQSVKAEPPAPVINIESGHKGGSPLLQQRSSSRNTSISSLADSAATPSSQSNSLKLSSAGASRPRGPRLTVQIPDGGSEAGGSANGESSSPRNTNENTAQPLRHPSTSVVLPPPSPSAQTLLSAGATGPPNPFARPPPQQSVNNETPVSALPSRFLNNELLPSPSSFYPEWNLRGGDSNTLPSPLNFATPLLGSGPSFLRDDNHTFSNGLNGHTTSGPPVPTIVTTASGQTQLSGSTKRKSPDFEGNGQDEGQESSSDPKRQKVD